MHNKFKLIVIILTLGLIVAIIKPFVNISIKNTNITSKEWIEDIDYLKEELPQKHVNLFSNITQEEFNSSLDNLKGEVNNLNSDEIQVKIMEVLAFVGDEHTTLSSFNDSKSPAYPIEVYYFKDGYYIVNASEEYKNLIGKKIISVNKNDISQVADKLSSIISKDNDYRVESKIPALIRDPRVLKAYNIINGNTCTFEVKDKDSETTTSVSMKPDKLSNIKFNENTSDRISLIDSSDSEKLEYIEHENAVYLRFDTCKAYDSLFSDSLNKINDTKAKNFIIDIRNNEGGTFIENNKLIEGCKDIQNNVKIYVIIGRKTFSSAILYADSLKNETNCTFYGEPTSASPNHYGDIKTLTLPNSKLNVSYSTKYFNLIDSSEKSFLPDVDVDLSVNDYLNNNDAVLNKILNDIKN